MEFGSASWSSAPADVDAPHPYPLFRSFPRDNFVYVLYLPMSSTTHDVYTVWLRPSKQIRAPLYSIKQTRQRRWIVSDLAFLPVICAEHTNIDNKIRTGLRARD